MNNGECEMGCVVSDGEDELHLSSSTSKRFKFPKKFFYDCSTVCHVSVPRKLRSAIKKRSRESVSPPSPVCKKQNHATDGVKLEKKESSKLKMKLAQAEGCATAVTLAPVTKDEEEVAEALYALSGVFPTTVKTNKNRLVGEGSGADSLALTEAQSFISPVDERAVGEVEQESKTVSSRHEAPNHSSNAVGSDGETVILDCSNDCTQADFCIGKQPPMQSASNIHEVNLPLTVFISENRHTVQKAICDSVVSGASTDLSKTRSKLPYLEKRLASVKYQEIVLAPIAAACSKSEVQCAIKETRNNGLSLRPDLSSAISCDSQGRGNPSQSHIANLPAWFESTSSSAQFPILNTVIAKKNAQVAIDSKSSWKRCSTHVYISRFIKVFQITESKKRSVMQSTEPATNEAPNQGNHISAVGLTGGRDGLIGVVSSDSFGGSLPEKNATEVRNAILLHQRLVKDQEQASMPFEVYAGQKQSLGFLSLPAGSGQMETNNCINRARNGMEVSALHFPYLLSQNQQSIPFVVPQNSYSSTYFSVHPSVAAVQKVAPYVGNTSYGPSPLMDATASSSQKLEQQQQKRSPLLMAHFKSGVPSPSTPNKQATGPDLPLFQRVHTLFPPSLSSLQVLGSRYSPILQQQHQQQLQLISATSLLQPPSVKGQYHHSPPPVYEEHIGGVRSDNVPLQIICRQYN